MSKKITVVAALLVLVGGCLKSAVARNGKRHSSHGKWWSPTPPSPWKRNGGLNAAIMEENGGAPTSVALEVS
jgi:hypothetical protein